MLVGLSGLAIVFFAGVRWVLAYAEAALLLSPLLTVSMTEYQQEVLTLLDPQSDPLGAGWNHPGDNGDRVGSISVKGSLWVLKLLKFLLKARLIL